MVNETTVKSFLVLARVGSFTEAARLQFLSQQAVSKQIAKLEQDLECTLFRRERGKLALTEAGQVYYETFSRMEALMQEARQKTSRMNDSWGDMLVIGVPELLDLRPITGDLTRKFQSQYPEVRVVFKSAPHWTVLDWLEAGKVDVAFTFEHEVRDKDWLERIPFTQLREMLVVSAEHPRATADASYLDFRNEPVFYTPDPLAGEAEIREKVRRLGFGGASLVPTDNFMSSSASVEQMQGVMFLLERCSLLRGESFRTYPTDVVSTIVLTYHPSPKKRCVRRFVDAARQIVSSQNSK